MGIFLRFEIKGQQCRGFRRFGSKWSIRILTRELAAERSVGEGEADFVCLWILGRAEQRLGRLAEFCPAETGEKSWKLRRSCVNSAARRKASFTRFSISSATLLLITTCPGMQ